MRRLLGSCAAAAGPAGLAAFLWLTAPAKLSPELGRLLPVSNMVQSFPVLPRPQPPALWLERMPEALAQRLWSQKSITWFQLWDEHAGSQPLLMLQGGSELDGLAHSLRLGPFRLVAANALSLQSVQAALQAQPATPTSCDALAGSPPALFWQGEALAQLLGSWAPLADPFRWGCLSLRGDRFWGEVSSKAAALQAPVQPSKQQPVEVLPDGVLLRLQGRRLAPLLQPPLDALSWPAVLLPHRTWLMDSPFQLELRRNPSTSAYRASLWLRLWPADRHRSAVARLQRQLESQNAPRWPVSAAGPIRRIQRADGQAQAGWRWFPSGELLVTLGSSVPLSSQPQTPSAAVLRNGLQLSAAPAAMQQLQVLPEGLPILWSGMKQLDAQWLPSSKTGQPAQLAGSLTWPVAAAAGSP